MNTFRPIADSRGAAMLETAIVAPLLMLVLFGIIQWGQLLGAHISLRNAASSAARAATLSGVTTAQVRQLARSALVSPLEQARLPDGQIAIADEPVGVITAKKVTLTYHFPLLAAFVVPGSSGGVLTITASAVMY